MTIHAFPHRVASPALIKPPSTPPRVWSGLGGQTQVQVAQVLAALMRRMTSGTSVTEERPHADRACP
jgi:hypothetical protein